jgi:predicted AAA+ superfamily ATPase
MSDSGLASYLTGIDRYSLESLRGPMLETYVAQNLLGVIESTWPEADLYFWHVQGRHEVDFVIEDHNKCMALEVKAGVRWDDRDLSGLRNFLSTTPQCVAGILAYNGREIAKIGKNLWAIPLSVLLS